MPSNKKKKKAAANPARGFATTSLPSKFKLDESIDSEAETEKLVPLTDRATQHSVQDRENATHSPSGRPALQEMTPEQLEAHLEDAELQSIVDTHGPRCRKDAGWQVTKLEAQRRTLRSQAIPMHASFFLSDDIVERVIELSQQELRVNETLIFPRTVVSEKVATEADLCLNIWTLQKTLEALHFPRIDEALKHLVKVTSYSENNNLASSRDYIWGLEECLDWLAIHSSTEELPSYTRNDHPPPSSLQVEPQVNDAGGEILQPATSTPALPKTSSLPATGNLGPEYSQTPRARHQADNPHVEAEQVVADQSSDELDDIDDDNEPGGLIAKYIRARSALLEVEAEQSAGRQRSHGSAQSSEQKMLASRIPRLRLTIENIERDILFDKDEAALQWRDVSKKIQANFWGELQSQRAMKNANITVSDSSFASGEAMNDSETSDEDLLGNMFEATQVDELKKNDQKEQENSVCIADFGSWNGVYPRRILEEACKARDPSCKVSFRQISSSFSNRQTVTIYWSSNQQEASLPQTTLSRLECEFRSDRLSISMKQIATPTAAQAESYVSTIALFAVFSSNAKEDKVFLRLPTVWRDLWKELTENRKSESDTLEKLRLADIRTLVSDNFQSHRNRAGRSEKDPNTNPGDEPQSVARPPEGLQKHPGQLQALWTQISSTSAFRKMLQSRSQLPIWEYQQQIFRTVAAQQVTILCAETGAGKSTQVPSFILQNELSAGIDSRILITQPRRISAISLAKRVSAELGEHKNDLGTSRSLVGYAIRLESKISTSTRITYATTGVLLRILESSPDLKDLNYLILDEIHEHTMDLDLLLIAIRRLSFRRPELRIILMSASLDAEKISAYFGGAPILNIPGRTFPVEVKYLEDAIEVTNAEATLRPSKSPWPEDNDYRSSSEAEPENNGISNDLEAYSKTTRAVLEKYDEYRIDYALIADLAAVISSATSYEKYSKAILIFMPGISEIRRLYQTLISHPTFIQGWIIHLLHSSFSTEDLERAFMPAPPPMRKIVIATNIAETGITIPDITAVIDTCKEKIMRFDERRQLSRLSEAFISRSSSLQRRGRAARVQAGLCFHLVTRYRHERLMMEHPIPEMLRLSLQDAVLRVKVWELGEIENTLSEALDPPSAKNIRRTIESLKEVKALSSSETLTPLGRQLARLPLDIWLGKLVVLGITFRCLDAAVTIAAMLSAKSPFVVSDRADARANLARLSFSRGESDQLLMLNAYLAWRRVCGAGDAYEFCRKNYLNQQALSQIEEQKVQLLVALSDAGILSLNDTEMSSLRRARIGGGKREFFEVPQRFNLNHQSDVAINSLIALAFYPKLLVRNGKGWRNVSTNQNVSLAPTAVNKRAANPPNWLSFYQAMQTKSNNLSVFDTSPVPESAIALLLGDAEFKLYSGVITIDGSKIRLAVQDWKTTIALKLLRHKIQGLLTQTFRSPGKPLSRSQQPWFELWQMILQPPSATDDVVAKREDHAIPSRLKVSLPVKQGHVLTKLPSSR